MAQFNPKEIIPHFRNYKRIYYSYDNELYAGTFPEDWATDHFPETGPKECSNCAHFGMWNGVFIGYCANCATLVYQGSRGVGFIDIGEEQCKTIDDIERGVPSAFETYLKGVNPYDVGDTDFMDSAKLINEKENRGISHLEDLIIDNNEHIIDVTISYNYEEQDHNKDGSDVGFDSESDTEIDTVSYNHDDPSYYGFPSDEYGEYGNGYTSSGYDEGYNSY